MYSFLEPLLPYKWKHLPRFRACHSFRRINSGIRDCHSSRRIKIINGGAVGERSTAQIDTRNIRFRWCFINSTYIHTRAVGRACAYSRQKNVYRWQIDRRFVAFHFVLSGFAEQKLLSSRVSSFYRATAIDPGIVESQRVSIRWMKDRGDFQSSPASAEWSQKDQYGDNARNRIRARSCSAHASCAFLPILPLPLISMPSIFASLRAHWYQCPLVHPPSRRW